MRQWQDAAIAQSQDNGCRFDACVFEHIHIEEVNVGIRAGSFFEDFRGRLTPDGILFIPAYLLLQKLPHGCSPFRLVCDVRDASGKNLVLQRTAALDPVAKVLVSHQLLVYVHPGR